VYIFSFVFLNKLEEWKKRSKYFPSFSTKYRKNGKRSFGKYSGNVGRMEETVEEENNFEL
jgi:hypothetical protein